MLLLRQMYLKKKIQHVFFKKKSTVLNISESSLFIALIHVKNPKKYVHQNVSKTFSNINYDKCYITSSFSLIVSSCKC